MGSSQAEYAQLALPISQVACGTAASMARTDALGSRPPWVNWMRTLLQTPPSQNQQRGCLELRCPWGWQAGVGLSRQLREDVSNKMHQRALGNLGYCYTERQTHLPLKAQLLVELLALIQVEL